MDLAQKKLAMFDSLLSGGGLQRLVDTAEEVLGNPLFIADMGLASVAVSSGLASDPFWTREAYEPETNDIRQASLAGDFRRVYSGDKTVVGDYPGSEQRYLAARIRRGDSLLGHAVVLERNKVFEPEDLELLPDICRVFGYELASGRDVDLLTERYGNLFKDILDGRVVSDGELEMRARRARLIVPRAMRALLVRQIGDTGQISQRYLRGQLIRLIPGCVAIVLGNDVLAVIDSQFEGLEPLLHDHINLETHSIGVSYPFESLAGLRDAFCQADAAIRLSGEDRPKPGLTYYQEVVACHLMECAASNSTASVFEHPAIRILSQSDELEGTDHLGDLEEYLFHGRNATATARSLHVHKNTMYYRLQRIHEIAAVDLDDEAICFALQLSIALHKGICSR